MQQTWDQYEAARRATLDAAWKELAAARAAVERLERDGAEFAELSAARTRLYRAELREERASYAE